MFAIYILSDCPFIQLSCWSCADDNDTEMSHSLCKTDIYDWMMREA